MDKIDLTGMEFYGYHGVLPEENKIGQKFIIDAVLFLDLETAGKNDDLSATVNYAEVYQDIRKIVEGKPVKLIEALAEKIADLVLNKYTLLKKVRVTVHKPAAPVGGPLADVSVLIRRERV